MGEPLAIATVAVPGRRGLIGIAPYPGRSGDLAADVAALRAWGAAAVLCLVEAAELDLLHVSGLSDVVRQAGLSWLHLPIVDMAVPNRAFESAWEGVGPRLQALLDDGGRLLVHCRGGLGRSGTIAARLLVEAGLDPDEAMVRVRAARPGAIETAAQERYLRERQWRAFSRE